MTAGEIARGAEHSGQAEVDGQTMTDEQAAGSERGKTERQREKEQIAHGARAEHAEESEYAGGPEQADQAKWPDRQVLEGPFTTRQLLRLDEALRTADESTGLSFSVYVGELTEPYREHAEQLHRQLPRAARAVLVAVAPNERALEIVTGGEARRRLPDRDCRLAAESMTSAFTGGDLAGGIVTGLAQLANRARGSRD